MTDETLHASAGTALAARGDAPVVTNPTTSPAWMALGGGAMPAAAVAGACVPAPPGSQWIMIAADATQIAALLAAGTIKEINAQLREANAHLRETVRLAATLDGALAAPNDGKRGTSDAEIETKYEKNYKRILNVIRKEGPIVAGDLGRKTQSISGKEREEVLAALVKSGDVSVQPATMGARGGRPTTIYEAVGDGEAS